MPMKTGLIIGQGATAMDTVFNCNSLPKPDGFARIYSEYLTSGGSAANTLTAASHLGCNTALVAQVGDDDLGKQFRRELLEDGISDKFLFEKKGGATMHTYVIVDEKGERSILVNPGDSHHTLTADQLPEDLMQGATLCYIDGSPGAVAVRMVEDSKRLNIPVFMQLENVPSAIESPFYTREQLMFNLRNADLISAGRDVYRELGGEEGVEQCMRHVYEQYRPLHGVLCTAGTQGCFWYDGAIMHKCPVFSVECIDSTGAGDSFCGGLMYAYFIKNMPREEAMRFANACGAMKCTQPGPRLRATEEMVREFMKTFEQKGECYE